MPCRIGDYTDFFTGLHHAIKAGNLFRPGSLLPPNSKWVPLSYHGRSSSIGVSGQAIGRPKGQCITDSGIPEVRPTQWLDYELELGVFIGPGNELGEPVAIDHAEGRLFGMTLLNDWSARDLQAWEMQPLGPFLAKNFASAISPWIVTVAALAPFRIPFSDPTGDPEPLPYLDSTFNRDHGGIDVALEVWLQSAQMTEPTLLSRSNFHDAYWTLAQMVTHHSVNGCNLQPGDLLGTGTQSSSQPGEDGSILELSNGDKQLISLPSGEIRTFLHHGDPVLLRGSCSTAGRTRIGFGDCRGTVLPAR